MADRNRGFGVIGSGLIAGIVGGIVMAAATMMYTAGMGVGFWAPLRLMAATTSGHEQKKKLGPIIHYSFGTLQGGIYGGLTELFGVNAGFLSGIAFGAALFSLADEVAVPALGLSGKPSASYGGETCRSCRVPHS